MRPPTEPRHAPEAGGRPASAASGAPPRAPLEGLARRIRALRERRGLTQEDFAKACGISVSFASQLERGERSPSYDTLLQVASALALPLSELLREPDPAVDEAAARLLEFVRTRSLDCAQVERLLGVARVLFEEVPAAGEPSAPREAGPRCREPGCARAVLARALCAAHYHRERRASRRG
jgi:transcriptional regulator with XRE-family HTH domain